MNAPAPISTLHTFSEITRETCLTCMGRGHVPYSIRNKFTHRLETARADCPRCRGTGRVESN